MAQMVYIVVVGFYKDINAVFLDKERAEEYVFNFNKRFTSTSNVLNRGASIEDWEAQ